MAAVEPDPLQYDAVAAGYESHAETAPWNALLDRPAVLDLLGEVAGLRVLDAGCGPGIYAEELIHRGADVIGCDASSEMIGLARRRLGTKAELVVHDLEQPLAWLGNGSVDRVVNALVLHHLTNRVEALTEFCRVLRPDGALIVSTHHPTADWVRLGGSYFEVAANTERWSKGWDITAWRMPLEDICDEFSAAGFVIERLAEVRPARDLAAIDPDEYERLMTQPSFIAFRLVKAPSSPGSGRPEATPGD